MEKLNPSKFSSGFLAGVVGWVISVIPIAIMLAILNTSGLSLGEVLSDHLLEWIGPAAATSAFIWLPVALIAGTISRRRGFKAARTFVIAAFFIALLVVGGCFGLVR
jgi:uncharacterized PurR-regulated membrane protein YhhQ (DUF165 family)